MARTERRLIPWPNRLADGRYRFEGVDHQLTLSEPPKQNAIHGLLRWRPWQASEREPHRVVMSTRLYPQPGYPFTLDVSIAYELGDNGLTVVTTAENIGEQACPYGAGQHPYVSPGEGSIDDCVLELPARTRCADRRPASVAERQRACARQRLRFLKATTVGRPGDRLGLHRPCARRRRARRHKAHTQRRQPCRAVGGRAPQVHQLYSGDTLAPSRRRRGLAVEPMTCAPNAFQSGEGLVRLEAGQALTTCWGVRLA